MPGVTLHLGQCCRPLPGDPSYDRRMARMIHTPTTADAMIPTP
jgi:hypothetical protein